MDGIVEEYKVMLLLFMILFIAIHKPSPMLFNNLHTY